ncbi:MAG: AAA family ATPase, partial [Candidatus Omnitrophica bacterium]|nr:AAA family ATPase [Candidatus Omnitrophota bacterium]
MKHIEKIIINNARRFGENIEIDFGVGATIILAPNGIGKTTVFEAMEFALTGDVKRLEGSLSAFIKDKLSVMSTRLEFSGGKYCQVDYAKGEESVLRGNHDELFSVENEASLPYLFRLTHFLEQRGVEWFVGKDETDAGNSLSMLPTGKDLQRILSKKKSLITLVRRAETDAETQLITGKEKLSDFEKLKAKKDTLAMKTALVPLKELVAKLFPI